MGNRSKNYQHIFAEVLVKDSILDTNPSNLLSIPFNLAYKIYTIESQLSIHLDRILDNGFSKIQKDTANLLKEGLSTSDIAKLRNVNVSTIIRCINGQGTKGGLKRRSIALIKENKHTIMIYINRIIALLPEDYNDLNLPTFRLVYSILRTDIINRNAQNDIMVQHQSCKKRNTMIKLSWTASSSQVSGYNVYRDHNAIPLNGKTPVAGTTFDDNTAVPG